MSGAETQRKEILWIREPMDIAIDRALDIQALEGNKRYSLTIVYSIAEAFSRLKIRSTIKRPFDAVIIDSWVDHGRDLNWKAIMDEFPDGPRYIAELIKSLIDRNGPSVPSSPQCFVPKNVVVILGNTQDYIDVFKEISSEIHALRFGQVGPITLRIHFDELFGFSD